MLKCGIIKEILNLPIFLPLLLGMIVVNNHILQVVHAGSIPAIERFYKEDGIEKVEVSILPGSNITVTPGIKGKIYFIDDYDNTESIIADIEVLDSLNNGVVHAKVLGRSPSIQITRGRYVRFWSPAQIADTTAPDGSVSINNGSSYTNTTSVTLTLSAADNVRVIGYYISTNPNPPSATASDWKPVASSKNYS